jgi:carboxypeptidase Q
MNQRMVRFGLFALIPLFLSVSLSAQEPVNPPAEAKADDPVAKIRTEGLEHSKVMETLSYLTDVIGPRLTNSPGMKRANEWTAKTLEGYGLENAKLEAWGEFGRGWELKKFDLQVVEPQCIPLISFPKAWSPGVEGELVAPLIYVDASTAEELDQYKGKLKGAIVLVGAIRPPAARFEPLASRRDAANLLGLADAGPPGAGGRGGFPPRTPSNRPNDDQMAQFRAQAAISRVRDQFLADEGVAAVLSPSSRGDGGTVFVQSASIPTPPGQAGPGGGGPAGAGPGGPGGPGQGGPGGFANRPRVWSKDSPKIQPQIVLAVEHYNRLARMLKQGEELKAALRLEVKFHDEDTKGYNTVAEIPGSDPMLKDEVVMLGGHMDSWHSAPCATDNAAGVAVCMEAVRIIKTLDLKPKRTIRIALWSGEEQGLYGSAGYVAEHFGARVEGGALQLKPEHEKLSGYFNLDNGTGKVRGIYLQGNEAVRPIFRKWLEPFRDLGASTITPSNTGGTDHQSFDRVGLPGFQFIQDEIEYDTRTHHSNMDEYDRAQADDLKQASVIMAAFVYNTAQLDEKLPRKPLPEAPPSRSTEQPAPAPAAAAGN